MFINCWFSKCVGMMLCVADLFKHIRMIMLEAKTFYATHIKLLLI